jgi:hypothetical protein
LTSPFCQIAIANDYFSNPYEQIHQMPFILISFYDLPIETEGHKYNWKPGEHKLPMQKNPFTKLIGLHECSVSECG